MEIRNNKYNDVDVLTIEGILNAENVNQLREFNEKLLQNKSPLVVLDFERLEQIDSSGIGAVISLLKKMRSQNGDVRIIKLRGAVKQLFELLRIDRGINIYESLDDAIMN